MYIYIYTRPRIVERGTRWLVLNGEMIDFLFFSTDHHIVEVRGWIGVNSRRSMQ